MPAGGEELMSNIQFSKITGPTVWKGADFAHDNSWVHELTADEIGGLEAALTALEDGGFDFPGFSRDDFSIGPLARYWMTWPKSLKTDAASSCCAACQLTGSAMIRSR